MTKSRKILSLLIIMVLVTMFTGCANNNDPSAPPTASGDTTNSPEPSNPSEDDERNFEFDYSKGIDENGMWENVKALDCLELTEYNGISIPKDIHTISDEAVDYEIEGILAGFATTKEVVDRAIVDGDTVNMDYVGTVDGVAFEGGNTNGGGTEVTIGVTSYIDDFLEQLIGHTPGESFDVEVTFPENYGVENLNGKDAIFAVTLNYIVESVTPEISDEFVKENLSSEYGWQTIEEMKQAIKSDLRKNGIYNYIQKYLVENSDIKTLPENILKYQEDLLVSYFKSNADYYSMELNEFLSAYAGVSNVEELLEFFLEDNTYVAKRFLVVQAIAEDIDITVTEDDIVAYFNAGIGEGDYSEYVESLGMPYLKLNVLNQKVMILLQNDAVLE